MPRKCLFFLIAFLVTFSILWSCQKKPEGKIIVKVNNSALTEEQIEEFLPPEYKSSVTLEQKKSFVQKWIENELLYQEARKKKIDQKKELQNRILNTIKDLVVMEFLDQEFGESVSATEEEARNFYLQNKDNFKRGEEEVRASHILLKSKTKADSVYQELKKGADFTKLAQQISEDSLTASQGGDLGFFSRSEMAPFIAEVAFKLKIGEVSAPIKSDYGYHILKVTDKKEKGTERDFNLIKDQILDYLSNEKRAQKVRELVEQLLAKAKIERFDWAKEGTPVNK
jgi:parvulin-like peptidyl-prolyl isomerase